MFCPDKLIAYKKAFEFLAATHNQGAGSGAVAVPVPGASAG